MTEEKPSVLAGLSTGALTLRDVRTVFRVMVKRAPDAKEVEAWSGKTLHALRVHLAGSADFRHVLKHTNIKFVGVHNGAPPNPIQMTGPPEQYDAMVARISQYWSGRGETDAEFSVITSAQFKPEKIEHTREQFYQLGVREFQLLSRYFERNGRSLTEVRTATDFGCGVARVTAQMAAHFNQTIGVDISPGHLRKAELRFQELNLNNGRFIHISSLSDIDNLPETDLFYSHIVLQHNPPPMSADILRRALAKVRKNGYALFQIPTFRENYGFSWEEYLKSEPALEMHSLPQRYIFEIFYELGFQLLECQEDRNASTMHTSHTFFAQRHK